MPDIRCDLCDKQLASTQGLAGHKRFVHGVKPSGQVPLEPGRRLVTQGELQEGIEVGLTGALNSVLGLLLDILSEVLSGQLMLTVLLLKVEAIPSEMLEDVKKGTEGLLEDIKRHREAGRDALNFALRNVRDTRKEPD